MNSRQKKTLIRLIISAVLLILAKLFSGYASLALYSVSYIVIGYDVLYSAILGIIHGELLDEKFLMAIATIGAVITGEYAEAVFVMLFYQLGEFFQSIAVGKSRKAISELMDLCPDTVNVIRNGKEEEVFCEEVEVGEIISVKPGEKIAIDGVIEEGSASIDAKALTGESLPLYKEIGDRVLSGMMNMDGVIKIRTESLFSESTASRIMEAVENASDKKSDSEKFITKFARYYTPIVVALALLLALLPPVFGRGWNESVKRALNFLVVSCPCALVVSVPLSFFGGIGSASKQGILIKGSEYLERFSKIDFMALDKTGTLTKGNFAVKEVISENTAEKELLRIAAEIECNSTHPIAVSIVNEYNKYGEVCHIAKNVNEIAGKGISAEIDGVRYFVGNEKILSKKNDKAEDETGSVIYVSKDESLIGKIVIGDEIKEDSASAIDSIKKLGVKPVMLTGDNEAVAKAVAREVGIDEYYFGLLPTDKLEIVKKLGKTGKKVAFAGDGINDAPVLSASYLGIAMGALGSDSAMEAADVVLMDDKLSKLNTAYRISKKTIKIVYENIVFAIAVKLIILILSAVGFAGMELAVFGDVGVLIMAILNAMRTMR